jgi:hypothetical protein
MDAIIQPFSHLFLKLLSIEILENLRFLGRRLGKNRIGSPKRRPRSLSEPETDQQNQDKGRQNEPRDHDDFDSQFARGRNVVFDIWIEVKESVTVAKNIHAA